MDEYEVGYKKPPAKHQFRKGVSGNPRGRKSEKTTSATEMLQKELDTIITVREGGKEIRISKKEAMIKAIVNDGITGKGKARSELIRLLQMTTPPEPFVSDGDDQADLDELLAQRANRDGEDEPNA